ncbi:MAG TPA: tetratricopeptide repeat-containing glycosyltransferase family protein [Aquabacterium sp.]|uniref:tetratricopeptide repeat-containing glycosyltransferase family protein n=1 Tax=Aquabacterium sp. TaxID=1872578 RepID=UPI002E339BB2|nr:tetratricopeptide repeat-containing glycosyltransferase family protein [Aquabacterium sp.]HEX5356200.1 tetratricopeptide repeat-containing glycosyltransferase family protein [Aquabacterium sp.]
MFGQPPGAQAQARFQQGLAFHQKGQLAEALQAYEQVIALQPKHFDALHLAGVILLQSGQAQRAVELMDRALKVDRNNANAYNNRGAAYSELGDHEQAILNYSKSISLQPDHANAYNNRGNVLVKQGRHEEALADFDKAISLNPQYFEAFNNRANALNELRRYDEARDSQEKAIALNPQSADTHWNLGASYLRLQAFEPGWRHSEWRMHHAHILGWRESDYAGTRWTGQQDIQGKTILLISEQGLGDTIQFSRYATVVRDLGAQVVFEIQPPLMPLLGELPGIQLVPRGAPLPAYDFYCPLMSVPWVLQTDLSNIPAPTRLTPVKDEQRARWQALLPHTGKPRVGVVWSGNPGHLDDYKRSMSLQTFSQLLCGEVDWVSLHKDVRDSDKAELATLTQTHRLADFSAQQHDFSDAMAMCEALDLVITVDTSIAHVAACMGRPVWLLLAHNADWRWFIDRKDSPWYPSMKLYRQDHPGDWADLLQKVKADVQAHFA